MFAIAYLKSEPLSGVTNVSGEGFVIGVGGGTGAGKTLLTDNLCSRYQQLGVAVIDQDSYYLDQSHLEIEARAKVNFDHPSSLDHSLIAEHVSTLLKGRPVEKPCYCFATHTRSSNTVMVSPSDLIIVEGIFALWDANLRSMMDLKIYIDADSDLRFIRRMRRDIVERGRTVQSVIDQYLSSVRPMHRTYIEPTREWADLIIDTSSDPDLHEYLSHIDERVATKQSIAVELQYL